jgi:hypothetical protein
MRDENGDAHAMAKQMPSNPQYLLRQVMSNHERFRANLLQLRKPSFVFSILQKWINKF